MIGLGDARAAAYGMYQPSYSVVRTGDTEAFTPCGSVNFTSSMGWFTQAGEEDYSNPDSPFVRSNAWAAWPLTDAEIPAVDAALAAAASCTGDSDGWAETGQPEPLSAPFAGPGARVTGTKGDRQQLSLHGRVDHLLVLCHADDLAAGDAQGGTHEGLTLCMARAGEMAALAQLPDLTTTTSPAAAPLLASRAQLEGKNTFPTSGYGHGNPCQRGPAFISGGNGDVFLIAAKGDPSAMAEVTIVVEVVQDAASARAAVQQQRDAAAACAGDYTFVVPKSSNPQARDIPMVLGAGVATENGDGGVGFTTQEQNSETSWSHGYTEAFSLGTFKVQVGADLKATPEEAKAAVGAVIAKLVVPLGS